MTLKSFGNIGTSASSGKIHYQYVIKPTIPTLSLNGVFNDLNQTSGIPVYNPFSGAPLEFTQLVGQKNQGIYPGNFISGSSKHLLRAQINNTGLNQRQTVFLNDYLGFYPVIDGDDTEIQQFDNTNSISRYTNGKGVRAILICAAPMVANTTATISYTNSNGVSGRTATFSIMFATTIGQCVVGAGTTGAASEATPFIPIGSDEGIRSVESIQFSSGTGGFMVLALVKPIVSFQAIREQFTLTEKCFGIETQMLPEITEGAYLNMMFHNFSSQSSNITAEFIFINT